MELVQFIKRVGEYYDDCTLGFPEIIEMKNESGLEKQEDTIHGMPYVLVEQHSSYPCEDCYYGYLFFPLKKRKYIRVPFNM
ncbi:hypothetical protein [Leclercia sp. CFBP8987]|uniref:hypothetical protein n=1 Tax=Leclercia sp. CFBP8987 TaxID=3096525 RepID=UPI002A69C5B4|nr:hypothetical protein [Leclercia sp. CFBP8987]MDY0921962.1 hypothetical protein [Leclercia sp. CFBP8987]